MGVCPPELFNEQSKSAKHWDNFVSHCNYNLVPWFCWPLNTVPTQYTFRGGTWFAPNCILLSWFLCLAVDIILTNLLQTNIEKCAAQLKRPWNTTSYQSHSYCNFILPWYVPREQQHNISNLNFKGLMLKMHHRQPKWNVWQKVTVNKRISHTYLCVMEAESRGMMEEFLLTTRLHCLIQLVSNLVIKFQVPMML